MRSKSSALAPATIAAYRVAAWTAHRLVPALQARRHAVSRWQAWAAARRPRPGPLVWIHAASVGEALTALPVAARLRASRPGLTFVLTHTSASLAGRPLPPAVDHIDYLPLDEPRPMRSLLETLRPRLLLFARADLWPELAAAAWDSGVPVAVIGASVQPWSGRLSWPVRPLFRALYRGLDFVGAASPGDAARLRGLGVRDAALALTGDPRHDQVLERIPSLVPLRPLVQWAQGEPVLVAGSTHVPDESILLDACAAMGTAGAMPRLVLCPHDPGPSRSARLAAQAHRVGVPAVVWRGEGLDQTAACVIVERVGLLADLYCLATLAYVGGGFGRRGVHAAIEPAAYAVPIIVGPRGHSADLEALLAAGGTVALPERHAAHAVAAVWRRWLDDPAARTRAGLAARRTLSGGAARTTAEGLIRWLPDAADRLPTVR